MEAKTNYEAGLQTLLDAAEASNAELQAFLDSESRWAFQYKKERDSARQEAAKWYRAYEELQKQYDALLKLEALHRG